jgi:hypothetical protein
MTAPDFQVTFDTTDCHALARFWAAALGYDVEDHHDQITELLAAGVATGADVVEIDGRRAWKVGTGCRDPEGRRPRLLFQDVPEAKTVKNRVHLDVFVGDEARAAEVERLIGLGASFLHDGHLGPSTWVTMADPEGNEFCLA